MLLTAAPRIHRSFLPENVMPNAFFTLKLVQMTDFGNIKKNYKNPVKHFCLTVARAHPYTPIMFWAWTNGHLSLAVGTHGGGM